MKNYFIRIYRRFYSYKFSKGFTLAELLVAILISTMVIVLASFALVAITSIDNKAEARIERQIDLNRAFDFMSHEIRMARRINRLADRVADGSANPSNTSYLPNVIGSASSPSFDLSKLGSYGTIVLYLEIPITNSIPSICPAGSPNAGSPPPAPTDYDRVVYDIRPTSGSWLNPRVIARYGRIPNVDGSIDPCKNPIASDILVDSISETDINPTCASPAVKFGAGGFYACVNGSLVDLFLRGAVGNIESQDVTGRALSRLGNYSSELAPVLDGSKSGTNMNLSWTWGGTGSATFKVYRTVDGVAQLIYTYNGSTLSFADSSPTSGKQNCYTVTAIIGSYTSAPSNPKCENF
jgi:prepilin-type N-terminal cleavage/methylation domain-containing protein